MKKQIKTWLSVVAAVAILAVAYYRFGDNSLHFREEVQLGNGEVIEIDRFFETQAMGEIGGPGGGRRPSTAS